MKWSRSLTNEIFNKQYDCFDGPYRGEQPTFSIRNNTMNVVHHSKNKYNETFVNLKKMYLAFSNQSFLSTWIRLYTA